uniref:Uncharacterized protein n=1 Tax=Vitis vinifera TaxID=29760 RepID=A5C4Q6_VITVI|nr:hypothetical protein VITISV_039483 [Vitis vinifera]
MPRGSLSLAHADGPPCNARHSSFHPGKNSVRPTFNIFRISHIWNSVRPTFHLLRISHIQNFVRPTFHLLRISHIRNPVQPTFRLLWISHIRNSVWPTFHLLRIFHIWRLTPDGRGGRFNFPGQTCPDPLIALTRRASVADNSDSPDSLARQTLAIRQIHFCPQSKSKLQ